MIVIYCGMSWFLFLGTAATYNKSKYFNHNSHPNRFRFDSIVFLVKWIDPRTRWLNIVSNRFVLWAVFAAFFFRSRMLVYVVCGVVEGRMKTHSHRIKFVFVWDSMNLSRLYSVLRHVWDWIEDIASLWRVWLLKMNRNRLVKNCRCESVLI